MYESYIVSTDITFKPACNSVNSKLQTMYLPTYFINRWIFGYDMLAIKWWHKNKNKRGVGVSKAVGMYH